MAQLGIRAPQAVSKPIEELLKETAAHTKEVIPSEDKSELIPSVVGTTRLTVQMEQLSHTDPPYFGSTIKTI
jgi:hypothetical protein